jgi:hypothetical protein
MSNIVTGGGGEEPPFIPMNVQGGWGGVYIVRIHGDTSEIEAKINALNTMGDAAMAKVDAHKSDLTLFFHVASNLLSELVGHQQKSLGLMAAQATLSVGLSSIAVARMTKEAIEAFTATPPLIAKGIFLLLLAGSMGFNVVRGQVLRFQSTIAQQSSEALRNEVERYTI